jgi:hypothetical protein
VHAAQWHIPIPGCSNWLNLVASSTAAFATTLAETYATAEAAVVTIEYSQRLDYSRLIAGDARPRLVGQNISRTQYRWCGRLGETVPKVSPSAQ